MGVRTAGDLKRIAGNALERVSDEAESSRASRLVISDEHVPVWLSKPEQFRTYLSALQALGDIRYVIVYLRRQDRMLESIGSEAINNRVFGWPDFRASDDLPVGLADRRFQYGEIVRDLEQELGRERVVIRPYVEGGSPAFDIVHDFVETCRLPDPQDWPAGSLYERLREWARVARFGPAGSGGRFNRSIPGHLLHALARIGRQASAMEANLVLREWRTFIQIATKAFPGPSIWLSPEARSAVLNHFAAENDALCGQYPYLASALCPQSSANEWPAPLAPVSVEALGDAVARRLLPRLRADWVAVCDAAAQA